MDRISAVLVKERKSYLSSDVLIFKKRFTLTADWIPWPLPRERVKFPRVSPPSLWSTTRSRVTSRWSKPGHGVNKREDEEEEEGVPRTKATKQLRTKRSRPACPSVTSGLCVQMFPSPQTYGRPMKPEAGFQNGDASEAWPSQCISFPRGPLSQQAGRPREAFRNIIL